MSERLRLLVLFGGRSAEHDISCISAESVLGAADRSRFEVTAVKIDREGQWEGGDPFAVLRTADVVFPILHGPMGEDGTVQGLLEVADVPYVGCGVLASALAMDKAAAKDVLAHHGIPQVQHAILPDRGDDLGWPRFVKPANMGSSVGVSRARDERELAAAVELATTYDERVVIEEAVVAREVECAVLGNREPEATGLGEIVSGGDFYDYEHKYTEGGAELFVPANVEDAVHDEARRLALRAFQALRCEGLARVDFFYEEGGRGLLVNEVNTMPGFTPFSMYPQLWASEGLPYAALVDRLVDLALDRHRRRASHIGRGR